MTLRVDTEQAKSLMLAYGHGEVSLTLRSPTDDKAVAMEGTVLSEGALVAKSVFDLTERSGQDEGEENGEGNGEEESGEENENTKD